MTTDELITRMHDLIFDDADHEIDHIELIQTIIPLIKTDLQPHICAAFDLCPMHLIDIDICYDDNDPECRSLINN